MAAQVTSGLSPTFWWNRIIEPHAEVQDTERITAQLTLAIAVASTPLAILAILFILYRYLIEGRQAELGNLIFVSLVLVFLITAYVLARTLHYRHGARILVAAPVTCITVSVLVTLDTANTYILYYLVLTPVLSSLLLTTRQTLYAALGVLIVAAVLVALVPHWWLINSFDELLFHVVVPVLLIVSTRVRQRYQQRIITQITELEHSREAERAARQEAERSNQVKSAFLASMSHELRTPLNAVINYAKFVVKGVMGPINERQTEALNKVVDSSKHLLNLINDVLDMSKIEAGSLTLFVEDDVSIQELLEQTCATAQTLLDTKPVTLTTEIAPDLPTLTGDRQRLRQVLLNVLSNACKFTEHGTITVRAAAHGDDLLISVQDTGAGIARADHPAVFEAFKQTDTGLRKGGGTGLGMPISRSLVQAHGGAFWFESEVGKGTTFFIRIPRHYLTITAVEESVA